MSAIVKIIKNSTASSVTYSGKTLQPGESFEIPMFEWITYSNNQGIRQNIADGDLIVNDGNSDLPANEGLDWLDRFQPDFPVVTKSKFHTQFQLIGDINYDEYIYSNSDIGSQGLLGNKNRSGDSSNGYRYSSSAPIICPFTGTLDKAVFALKGVAVSTGSAAATVTVNLELWSVGFNNEGTKLGDLDFDIDSGTYTIGNWWNSSVDTNFKGSETYNIAVSEGDLLAVKFKRVQNNSNAVGIKNLTLSIQIIED